MNKEFFFILMKECLAERRMKTSLFYRLHDSEETSALCGSLWYMKSDDFDSMSHGKAGRRIVLFSAEQNDVSIVIEKLHDVAKLTLLEYQLLLAVTTCKERAAVYKANGGALLRDACLLYHNSNANGDCPFQVDVIDRKGSHEEQLTGQLVYAGPIIGRNGYWFAVEFPTKYSGDLHLTDGVFDATSLFRCCSDRTVLVAVDKLSLCSSNSHQSPTIRNMINVPQLEIGDRVLWISPTDSHEFGTVKWIGVLPDACVPEYTVGVEFDNPIGSGTGTYKSQVLFDAIPKHASLVPVSGLIKAADFLGDVPVTFVSHSDSSGVSRDVAMPEPTISFSDHQIAVKAVCNESQLVSGILTSTIESLSDALLAVAASEIETDMEIGCMVQVDVPGCDYPLYGVIRWMGKFRDHERPVVGIEMEEEIDVGTDGTFGHQHLFACAPKHALFTYLHRVHHDMRFLESSVLLQRTGSLAFGSIDCPDVIGNLQPLSFENCKEVTKILGTNKGIQGHQNSCYMDATLFSMFAFSMVFDSMLYRPAQYPGDIEQYEKIQQVLREGIVNPLRSDTMFVRADKVMELRKLLSYCSSVEGLINEEKDPEEFLSSLLHQTLRVEPFLKFSSGQESYFYQLFLEKDEVVNLPTTQHLLGLSLYQSDLKFIEVPSCLILQMPRFGKEFKMYRRIIPSLSLDITDLLQNDPRPCFNCGHVALLECKDCYSDVMGGGTEKQFFCCDCHATYHRHPKRIGHTKPRPVRVNADFLKYVKESGVNDLEAMPRETLDLFAVICIRTSHYVAFVKCGTTPNSPWIFFDSMADRIGQIHGYNVPKVELCTELPSYLQQANQAEILKTGSDKELPELMRRLLCDGYICMYQNTSLMKYR